MIFLSVPLVVIFYMLGGQINKLFRPIGVPLSIIGIYLLTENHVLINCLPILWYAFTLTLGYGENSKLGKWLKSEQKVRIVLGLSSSIPIIILAIMNSNYITLLCVPAIVAVECIRMGRWGHIGNFDILPVDIFRGLIVGLACSWSLL